MSSRREESSASGGMNCNARSKGGRGGSLQSPGRAAGAQAQPCPFSQEAKQPGDVLIGGLQGTTRRQRQRHSRPTA